MHAIRFALAGLALVLATPAMPQSAPSHPLGDHPAVVAKRLHARQGYDYASRFYPHPAWLHLLPAAPDAAAEGGALLAAGARQPAAPAPGRPELVARRPR